MPDAPLICVICYFDGPGEEFVENHPTDTRKVLVCQRVDGKEPETADYEFDTGDVIYISGDE